MKIVKHLTELGILGFIGISITYIIDYFIPLIYVIGIIFYEILYSVFSALIVISLFILGDKNGKNGLKVASICILNTIIFRIIIDLVYYINSPVKYSLEFNNIMSFIYGINTINFFIFIIMGVAFGFSLYSLGKEYSIKFLQVMAVLWVLDVIISLFIQFFSYLIIFHWMVYLLSAIMIYFLINLKKYGKRVEKVQIKTKIGFGK